MWHSRQPETAYSVLAQHDLLQIAFQSSRDLRERRDLVSAKSAARHFVKTGFLPWKVFQITSHIRARARKTDTHTHTHTHTHTRHRLAKPCSVYSQATPSQVVIMCKIQAAARLVCASTMWMQCSANHDWTCSLTPVKLRKRCACHRNVHGGAACAVSSHANAESITWSTFASHAHAGAFKPLK
jgi:hypothetical protein